jgi:uncharacterized protein (TIGR02147 family)
MNLEIPRPLPRHYSDIIRDILNSRVIKNNYYSLRAFARDLNLTPSHLSEVLARKTNLSLKKGEEIAKTLHLSKEDQKLFCKLVEIANANDLQRNILEQQLYNFDSSNIVISRNMYASISEWHSLALLELISLRDFKYNLNWIAEKLSISTEEAKDTIENLLKIKLIEFENDRLKKQYDYFVLPNGNKSNSAKDFHKLILKKAATAIDEQPTEMRNFTGAFLHIKKDDIQKISDKIKCFRRELAKEFESENASDAVYMFSIQLFRADNPDR